MGGYLGDPRGREAAIEDRQARDDFSFEDRRADRSGYSGGYDRGPGAAEKIDVGKLFKQSPITKQHQPLSPVTTPVREPITQTGSSPSQDYGGYSSNIGSIVTGLQNENVLRKQAESVKKSRTDKINDMVNKAWNKALSGTERYVGLDPYEVVSHLSKPAAGNVTLDLPWDASFQQRSDQSANKALDFYDKTNTAQKFASGNPFQGLEAIGQLLGIAGYGTLHQGIHGVQNIFNQTTPGSYPNFADWWGNMVGLKRGLLGQGPIEQGN